MFIELEIYIWNKIFVFSFSTSDEKRFDFHQYVRFVKGFGGKFDMGIESENL